MKKRFTWVIATVVCFLTAQSWGQSAQDSLRENAQIVKDRLDGVVENVNTLNSDVAQLKGIKITGYLQARYEYNDSSKGTALYDDFSKNPSANNFYIRRCRLKVSMQPGQTSKFVFYLDASKNTVSLKEAYVDLYKKVKQHSFTFTAGQFNYPFGYEIEYSSSKRDFPERSLAENKLFKGERDRGVNFAWVAPKHFKFNIGLVQGYGIDGDGKSAPSWYDPTKAKDVIARGRVNLGKLDFGVSGYWGKTSVPGTSAVAAKPGVSTWYDANGNNAIDVSEVTTTAPVAAKAAVAGFEKDKIRYGIDAQYYLDVLPLGGTGIRVETFFAKDYNKSVTADSLARETGWYLWVSQNLGKKFGAAVRYDYWDPNKDAVNDATGTLSLAMHYFWDNNVRITAAYDMPRTLKGKSTFSAVDNDLKDNRFTLQFQFVI
jgi:hypothetical protein